MGLWLEHRENGVVNIRERFQNGKINTFESEPGSVEEAIKLARQSNDQPLEKREWVLRIGFNE